jgi:two-component system response regulator
MITYCSAYLSFGRFDKTSQKAGVARTVGVNAPDTEAIAMAHKIIFLVDDDANFAELTKAFLLQDEGVANEVVLARDGVEAVEHLFHPGRAAPGMPDLVLLDLTMPRMDGFWVLRKMRAAVRTRFIPVVIMTSSVDPEDVRMAYALGANGYLDKLSDGMPWDELVRTVARYWLGMSITPNSLAGKEDGLARF